MTFEWFIRFEDGQPKTVRVPEDRVNVQKRRCRDGRMSMLIVFFFFFLILKLSFDHEFVPRGQTMNRLVYKRVLIIRLRQTNRKKRPDKWRRGTRFLHPDNEPDTFNAVDSRFSADKKIPVVPRPPCPPDPPPCFIFPRLKPASKGQRFQEEIKTTGT